MSFRFYAEQRLVSCLLLVLFSFSSLLAKKSEEAVKSENDSTTQELIRGFLGINLNKNNAVTPPLLAQAPSAIDPKELIKGFCRQDTKAAPLPTPYESFHFYVQLFGDAITFDETGERLLSLDLFGAIGCTRRFNDSERKTIFTCLIDRYLTSACSVDIILDYSLWSEGVWRFCGDFLFLNLPKDVFYSVTVINKRFDGQCADIAWLLGCCSVYKLALVRCQIVSISKALQDLLPSIRELVLDYCLVARDDVSFIKSFSGLRSLSVNATRCSNLSTTLNAMVLNFNAQHCFSLEHLEIKNISFNRQIDRLSPFIISGIKSLTLENCGLRAIPESLREFNQLQELSLRRNNLSAAGASFAALARLDDLEKIHLIDTKIDTLPQGLVIDRSMQIDLGLVSRSCIDAFKRTFSRSRIIAHPLIHLR